MDSNAAASRAERLKRAQAAMQAGNFVEASKLAADLLAAESNDQDGLYMAAVAARYLGNIDQARAHLAALKQVAPDYGRAFQEEGHLSKATGDNQSALLAYQNATRCNPALTASWRAQADLLHAAGNTAEADQALAQLQRIKALPRELLAITNHLHEGRILRAEEIARTFLRKEPQNIEGMRLLADIGSRLGVHEDADFLLETAIALDPDNIQLRIDHIQVLRKRQKFTAALEQAKSLLARDPESPVFQSLFAIESMQAGDYDTALDAFEKVLAKLPNDPATLTSRGHALKTCGRSDEAIVSYQAALRTAPHYGDAWYALANLKTYRFSDDEVREMEAMQERAYLTTMSQIHIAFALGKAFEDRSNHEQAFQNYQLGNALKQKQTRYTTPQMQDEFEAQKTFCTPEMISTQSGKGCPAPDPIFIVGLPRAGSTLIEQILASHSQVDGTLELPNILSLAHRLRGRNLATDRDRYPRVLAELSADELHALGEDYIENTRVHRRSAPFFTDKMPNNFRHIGLIHLILPNAKIIDARRAPLDCCWSGYKQLFAEGQEFTYGLDEIGKYYRGYVDLMAHWDSVLPEGRILRVQHEDVLENLEEQIRRLLDYCELPFEAACVDFHKTDRAVRTASSEQVRQPITRAGQEQWRPFELYLAPLKAALGEHS
ncbi:MAG: sulfotransferase [Henriciella sp.]|nr:sulfotransferase [Henriciella sp.]MBO6696598.1 sulfotransferase [Henriciella sp.]